MALNRLLSIFSRRFVSDAWIPGRPDKPGWYWIATRIGEGVLIRMAEFYEVHNYRSGSPRLIYRCEDSTWEQGMDRVHYHRPVPDPAPPSVTDVRDATERTANPKPKAAGVGK